MLRVGLVDDSQLLRLRVRALIADLSGVTLVGEATSLAEARRDLAGWSADVVVLDLRLTDGNGLDLLVDLKGRPDAPAVIVFTNYSYHLLRDRCLAAGADVFLDKVADFASLPATLRQLRGRHGRSPHRPGRGSGKRRRAA